MNPYIINQAPWTFQSTTQGTGLQDQFNQQAMQQMGQLAGQAGQSQQGYQGASPMSLANMLRKTTPNSSTDFLNQGASYPSTSGLNLNASDYGISPNQVPSLYNPKLG